MGLLLIDIASDEVKESREMKIAGAFGLRLCAIGHSVQEGMAWGQL